MRKPNTAYLLRPSQHQHPFAVRPPPVASRPVVRFSCRRWGPALTSAIMLGFAISRFSAALFFTAAIGLGCGSCDEGTAPAAPDRTEGAGLSSLDPVAAEAVAPRYLSSAVAKVAPSASPSGPSSTQARKDAAAGLKWAFEPPQLRVYRATPVRFRLDTAPDGHETASCSWNFGDGTTAEGCVVSHTFMSGLADEVVTLTLHDGDWEYVSRRTIALERFAVVDGLLDGADPLATSLSLPDRPTPADRTFRFAVVADTVAGTPAFSTASKALKTTVHPELIIHAGGVGDRGALQKTMAEAGIKVVYGQGPADRDAQLKLPAPSVQLLEGSDYPRQYAFTYKGVFFMVIGTTAGTGGETVTEATLKWMRRQLAKANVYEARYVVSYLPLRKFSEMHVGTLDKNFRLYELLLRARVTALFSGAYRVFYKGTYGALSAVSVGAIGSKGGQLLGHEFKQPASFVGVDIVKGAPKRTFAVEGPEFDRVADEALLPASVGMYRIGL